jgi:DNA replication initiation complex subunit (GINS family)
MITYNDIYEAARKERYSEQLQLIPKNFVVEVSKYLKEKKELVSGEGEFSDNVIKIKKQLENAITLFKELIIRRRKKILNLVLIASETGISKQDFENMLAIEKELFEELVKCADSSDKKLNGLLSDSSFEVEQKNEMVVFLNNVGEFVGMDGESLGPFEKGQVANLPKEVVKILVDGKKVEVVEK